MQASVEETTVGAEERVIYTIEVEGARVSGVKLPQPPETEGLALVSPYPSSQRRMSVVNGVMQQSVAFQWAFRPLRAGRARIGPTTVTVDDRSYSTAAININVVPQNQRPQRRSQPRSPFGTPPSSQPESEEERSSFSGQDLFIRAVPSERAVYQNEQVTVEYVLYFRNGIQLRQSRLADSWDADGFWREDLEVDVRPIPEATVQNGMRYHTIVLKRAALFPTRPGTLTVEPLQIESEAYTPLRSGDPFEQLFSRGTHFETVELSSPALTVEVRPLPPGAPASFKGAVGTFEMDTRVNRTELDAGEPLEVEVTLTGTGNIATLAPPTFEPPGNFEPYDPQVQNTIRRRGTQISGTKSFTYVLVPRTNGRFELPPVEFTYFDPNAERYVTLASEPVAIQVTGTAPEPVASDALAGGLPVDDVAGIMTGGAEWVRADRRPLHTVPWTYAALGLPLVVLAGLVFFQRHRARLATDVEFARSRKAHPAARKHLKQAEGLLRRDEPQAFYAEVERAVLGFIGNRLNIPERGLTWHQLSRQLTEYGASEATLSELQVLLEECDRVRFSPLRPDRSAMQTASDRAARIIADVDRVAGVKASAPAVG